MDIGKIEIELEHHSGTFTLLSYVAMYSFICPFISCMIFINNIVVMRFERYVHFECTMRKPLLHVHSLGYFNRVIEILS